MIKVFDNPLIDLINIFVYVVYCIQVNLSSLCFYNYLPFIRTKRLELWPLFGSSCSTSCSVSLARLSMSPIYSPAQLVSFQHCLQLLFCSAEISLLQMSILSVCQLSHSYGINDYTLVLVKPSRQTSAAQDTFHFKIYIYFQEFLHQVMLIQAYSPDKSVAERLSRFEHWRSQVRFQSASYQRRI